MPGSQQPGMAMKKCIIAAPSGQGQICLPWPIDGQRRDQKQTDDVTAMSGWMNRISFLIAFYKIGINFSQMC